MAWRRRRSLLRQGDGSNSEPTKDRLDTGHPSTGGNALRAFPARCISDSEGSLNSGGLVPVSRLLAVREQKSPAVFE